MSRRSILFYWPLTLKFNARKIYKILTLGSVLNSDCIFNSLYRIFKSTLLQLKLSTLREMSSCEQEELDVWPGLIFNNVRFNKLTVFQQSQRQQVKLNNKI